jgi:hypothetical protein
MSLCPARYNQPSSVGIYVIGRHPDLIRRYSFKLLFQNIICYRQFMSRVGRCPEFLLLLLLLLAFQPQVFAYTLNPANSRLLL